MKKKTGWIVLEALLLAAVVFVLIYTRPRTVEERYPALELSGCVGIEGYYFRGTDGEDSRFVISPEDADFDDLLELVETAAFRTRLRNLFPRGTKTYSYGEEDFRWNVMLRFADTAQPDGSTVSGTLLHVDDFFGRLELFSAVDGKTVACSVKDGEQWVREIMDLIEKYPAE